MKINNKYFVHESSYVDSDVSIGDNTKIENSVIYNTIIQSNSELININLKNSMIGNFVSIDGSSVEKEISAGDFSEIK